MKRPQKRACAGTQCLSSPFFGSLAERKLPEDAVRSIIDRAVETAAEALDRLRPQASGHRENMGKALSGPARGANLHV